MTPEEFARDSWQSENAGTPLPPISELRERADKFPQQNQTPQHDRISCRRAG